MHGLFAPLLLSALFACAAGCASELGRTPDACAKLDATFTRSSFVIVTRPVPGQRVASPIAVSGCSNTFEANVVWELRSRAGALLSRGHATGGSFDQPREFRFSAPFEVSADQVGALTVFEPDESDGEGFPPPRVIVPYLLSAADTVR